MDIDKDSFGKDSIFGKLHSNNGKLLFLGAPFLSCTFLHYIEQDYGVTYRYMKTFKGKIKAGGSVYEDACTFFVRRLDKHITLDTTRLEKYLLDKGVMKEVRVGYGRILLVEADALFKEGKKLLDEDINFFLGEQNERS